MIYEKKYPNEKYILSLGGKNKQNNIIKRNDDDNPCFSSAKGEQLSLNLSSEDDFCFDLSDTSADTNMSFISSNRAKLQEKNNIFRSISS